jgi:hypothetical protein
MQLLFTTPLLLLVLQSSLADVSEGRALKKKSKKKDGDECASAVKKIEDIIGHFKKQEGVRCLEAFHEDATTCMLAGHLEDGHQIRGRDHLHRCMAKLTDMPPLDDGTSRQLTPDDRWSFFEFSDTDYAGVKQADDSCAVYLSLDQVFDPEGGNNEEGAIRSKGIVRYELDTDGLITSKFSLNDYCVPDENLDANPDPNYRDLKKGGDDSLKDCDEALMMVEKFVQDNSDGGDSDYATVKNGKDSCWVYYSMFKNPKRYLVRYEVDLKYGSLSSKLTLDDSTSSTSGRRTLSDGCVVKGSVNDVP